MRALFNADCSGCQTFKPHCATAYLRVDGTAARYSHKPTTLCQDCRQGAYRGRYRLHAKHGGSWGFCGA